MNILKEFDLAIVKTEGTTNGYRLEERIFDSYLSNQNWEKHLAGMSQEHRRQYGAGSGGELEEQHGRPPKMASFASSSRMIYNLSKDVLGFVFEKQLTTVLGGIANLDGYVEREGNCIFVEAKCREPYSHTAIQNIKQNYKPIYAYLREKMPRVFSCVMEDIPESEYMRVVFFCRGDSDVYFDIKQMICHLLAVANEMLSRDSDGSVLFLYLLYNPTELPVAEERKCELLRMYEDTCKSAKGYRFAEMYGHILDFLVQRSGMDVDEHRLHQLKESFCFALCDQNDYLKYLE